MQKKAKLASPIIMRNAGLRPLKTKLKVSGMFKTLEGANNYCGILSIISTAIKQKRNPIKILTDAIKNKADILFA